ncbi:MAG: hemerythrin domain-containing protein [Sulfuritalea sp.]|nr:hemerythrin domain-containing protein [Sulfuritalea sp.]
MKRHPQLQDLSREHHGALKLARAARQAAESGEMDAMTAFAQRVVRLFATELDPHFRVEEQGILVALARAGENELVERTLSEHAELRRLTMLLSHPDAATLLRFADLLTAHVRFEERELFEAAQHQMAAS